MPTKLRIDPRLLSRLAANRTSRRRFIGGGAAAAAAVALGGSFLAACSIGQQVRHRHHSDARGTRQRHVADLELAAVHGRRLRRRRSRRPAGLTVDYKEDFNDNEQWFAKVKEPLSRKQDIGADLVVPTQFMAARIKRLGWLNEISDAGVPNRKNLRPDLLDSQRRPGPQVHRALHDRHGRAGLQQGRHRSRHHDDRRPVGSGVQGPGQPALRHPGRARHDHAVAGQLAREPDHRGRAEGGRPGQGAEGQGPDPPLHRQRLRRRPRGGQYRCRPGIFG